MHFPLRLLEIKLLAKFVEEHLTQPQLFKVFRIVIKSYITFFHYSLLGSTRVTRSRTEMLQREKEANHNIPTGNEAATAVTARKPLRSQSNQDEENCKMQ